MTVMCISCILNKKEGSTKVRPVPNTKENRDKIGITKTTESTKSQILCEACIEELKIKLTS